MSSAVTDIESPPAVPLRLGTHTLASRLIVGTGRYETYDVMRDSLALSLLAGAVFPRLPLAVRWRMALLYALLAVHERFPLTPRRRAYALAEMAPEPDSVQSSTRVHELLTQIEASRVEAREAAPGAAELVRQDRDER